MNLENLLSFVCSHSITAWIEGGNIYAVAWFTNREGQLQHQVECVGNTLTACRDWLQY